MELEDAQKALNLARKHDANGNKDAALKWARKSVSIYSTPEATTLVSRLETLGTQGTPSTSDKSETKSSETTYTSTTTTKTMPNVQGEKKDYTQTQIEVVRRVKRAGGDFYSVLQIDKSATDSDIKKSYKKVSAARSWSARAAASPGQESCTRRRRSVQTYVSPPDPQLSPRLSQYFLTKTSALLTIALVVTLTVGLVQQPLRARRIRSVALGPDLVCGQAWAPKSIPRTYSTCSSEAAWPAVCSR